MSKSNNVNPGQYKVAGRNRPGDPLGQSKDKEQMAKNREAATAAKKTPKKGR